MPDLVHITYAQTGQSSQTNLLGMREMSKKFANKLKNFNL